MAIVINNVANVLVCVRLYRRLGDVQKVCFQGAAESKSYNAVINDMREDLHISIYKGLVLCE